VGGFAVPEATPSSTIVRFGVFELDLRAGELRKQGLKVKLQERPLQILALLLAHPGEVVKREELRQQLWPADTFVDFDHSVNTAINKLRESLGDSAESPRFIETLPRHGYRFISAVDPGVETHAPSEGEPLPEHSKRRRWLAVVAVAAIVVFSTLVTLNVAGLRGRLLSIAGAGHGAPLPKIESIAVLPLENLSGDPQQEYFADGMTEELITDLGKISALRVTSRQSIMRYKDSKKPLQEIARELHVDAIVEGTVLRSGNRVRITANLLYAPSDRHLWAQTYQRDLVDVLSLQDEVARAIASQIRVRLTPQENARLAATRPVNPEAYRLYLQGRYYFFKRTLPSFHKSIQLFQQALEKDPNSALAYAGLSESYGIIPLYDSGASLPIEWFPKAKASALKAVELDSSLAEAHAALGYVLFYYDWDWAAAERELKGAIELKPNYAVAHQWFADYLIAMGRHEQAFAEIRRAQELDPVSPFMRYIGGEVYLYAGLYDEAIEQCRRALELDSNFAPAHVFLGLAYVEKGTYKEAIAEFEENARLLGDDPSWFRAYVSIRAGRRGEAETPLNLLWQQYKRGEIGPMSVAPLYARLGDKQRALDLLERGYEQRSPSFVFMNVPGNDDFGNLRSDPRFQNLLRRMNFPP
jgi:TolB-like protein/DNA-binding winged helix-turn-helix (wHTH) protein/Flp pilus assembly protein TadD